MANIKLKDKNGNVTNYSDVAIFEVPSTVSGETVQFVDANSGNALAGDILSGKTAFVGVTQITGTIPTKAAATYTPGDSTQTINANQYLSGAQTISAVPTETKTATANGTITPTSGKYLSSVTVAIPVYNGSIS